MDGQAALPAFGILCVVVLGTVVLALRAPSDEERVRSALRSIIEPADVDYLLTTQKVIVADSATLGALGERIQQIGAVAAQPASLTSALWLETAILRNELRWVRLWAFCGTGLALSSLLVAVLLRLWPAG